MAEPFPKSKQLARGERRYRRKVASPKQWQAIQAAKIAACRICHVGSRESFLPLELHHLVPRDFGGDDLADNVVPLCHECHWRVTNRQQPAVRTLLSSLSDAEYAYAVGKLGEQVWERVYGVTYAR